MKAVALMKAGRRPDAVAEFKDFLANYPGSDNAAKARERLRLFDHLGFRRVDVPYVQPALAADKQAIDYLDLLFAPWPDQASVTSIPTRWVLDTLEPVWSAWSPATATEHLTRLRRRVSGEDVALTPLSAPSS